MYNFVVRSCLSSNRIMKLSKPLLLNNLKRDIRPFCSSSSEDLKFDAVYHYPFIKFLAPFCGLSKYCLNLTAATVPIVGALEFVAKAAPEDLTIHFGVAGGFLTLAFLLVGQIFRNTIGYIYTSNDDAQLKISYINRWGVRTDTIIPHKDWVPLSELKPIKPTTWYMSVRPLSGSKKYKLFYRQGVLTNRELADFAIGTPKFE